MTLAYHPEAQGSAATVLVADDDPLARRLWSRLLRSEGYQVLEAKSGTEALEIARGHHPHTIVLDVCMPEIDGLECARRLKADPELQDIPVIMATGKEGHVNMMAGLEAGADEYLTKPLHHREFILRVRSMVRYRLAWLDLQASHQAQIRQARSLNLLLGFSRHLAATDDLDRVLDLTVEMTASLTGCRRISIMLPSRDNKHLRIATSIGLKDKLTDQTQVPIGTGIAGQVFASGRSLVANTAEAMPVRSGRYDTLFFASVPLVCAVMTAPEKTVGVLNATERPGGRPFDPQDLQCLDLICNYAAAAIHGTLNRRARDEARDSVVFALAKLAEQRDNETGRHLERMVCYCLTLARQLRRHPAYAGDIDDEFLASLHRAAPLHDIGKVAVPDHILLKPGKLTPAEAAVMRAHTTIGAETIRSVLDRIPGSAFLKMAQDIAHHHHEWFDGSGYPDGIRGLDIPVTARIAALADVYDALTSRRTYKRPWSCGQAAGEIGALSGTQFDPDLVDAFLQSQDEFARLTTELADPPDQATYPPWSGATAAETPASCACQTG